MEEIGKTLRETRERLGLTLDEIERTTRIRKPRLEALERGEMDSLPSQAQARGFLRNYADALGLDARELLERYDAGRGKGHRGARRSPAAPPVGKPRSARSGAELAMTSLVALAVMALLVWGGGRILGALAETADTPTPEGFEAAAPATPTKTSEPSATPPPGGVGLAVPTQPSPTATLLLTVLDRVNLRVVAENDAFVEVLVDGEQAYRGRMQAGDEQRFIGDETVELITGNAGGLRIYFNEIDQGLLGEVGQVVVRLWTPRGAQTPTPTVTQSPSPSPFLTATPTATDTVSPALEP